MSSKVRLEILAPLSQYTENQKVIEYEGESVRQILDLLSNRYPRLREQLYASSSMTLREFINIFLNGEDIRGLNGLDTKLKDNDRITIMPAIAGG